jgi:hypothetical protein
MVSSAVYVVWLTSELNYALLYRSRVLCVFTTGQLWQFKAYHWSKPKELFQNGKPICTGTLCLGMTI